MTATYTVTVTRKAQEDADEPDSPEDEPEDANEPDSPEDELEEPGGQSFVVNGQTLYPSQAVPEGLGADGFETGEITLGDQTVPAFVDTFAGGTLQLVWLVDENGENGDLYLMLSGNQSEAYDYVCLHAEKGFLVILPDGDGSVPQAYAAMPTVLNMEGYGSVDAWFPESGRELALVYAVNQLGERGWYTLDTLSYSYVRYQEPSEQVLAEEPEPTPATEEKTEPDSDDGEQQKLKKQNHLIIGAAVIAVLIVLTILILVTVLKHSREDEDEELYEEEDDLFREDGPETGEDWSLSLELPEEDEKPKKLHRGWAKDEELTGGRIRKRYDRSVFEPDGQTESRMKQEDEPDSPDLVEDALLEVETGLAGELAKEMTADISRIADPAPMQTVSTHKDKDDEDLEFIDL